MQCEIKVCCSGCLSDLVAPGFSPGHLGAVRRHPGPAASAQPSPLGRQYWGEGEEFLPEENVWMVSPMVLR